MQIAVRPWQPGDRMAAWAVLREASFSNVWPSFLIALRRPIVVLIILVVMAANIVFQTHAVMSVLCLTSAVGAVYCVCLGATVYFLYGPNFNDMKNVEAAYFSSSADHFWVAEVDHEIVGTIAVVEKHIHTPVTEQPDTLKRNHLTTETVNQRIFCKNAANRETEHVQKMAWLRRMAVKRKFRGYGIAKRLVQVVIDFCEEQNYEGIFLITTEVHQPARSLYTSMGFKQKAYKPYKYLGGFIIVWTYEFEMPLSKTRT